MRAPLTFRVVLQAFCEQNQDAAGYAKTPTITISPWTFLEKANMIDGGKRNLAGPQSGALFPISKHAGNQDRNNQKTAKSRLATQDAAKW
ncbi:MAG: hypothetical protein IPK53_19570 [bacterium]|nr:hypothetical protein [bacterium]